MFYSRLTRHDLSANDELQFNFSEVLKLPDYLARVKHAIAAEDERAAQDLLQNFRIADEAAYRIAGALTHGRDNNK